MNAVRAPVRAGWLREVVLAALSVPEIARAAGAAAGAGLTVRITGDRELRRLNREFLGVDESTDVLSFPFGDGGEREAGPSGEDLYLGDIAVSWPAACRQAGELGHTPPLELAFLVVHGVLHLAGFDHGSPAVAAEMERLSAAALLAAGLEPVHGRL